MRQTTGYLLSRICHMRRARGSAMLDKIGLYRGQHFVLSLLWEQEGLTHSELAERLRVQPSTVTNALKRMEKAGLLERRRDMEDQRVSRVYLTNAGRGLQDDVERVWRELEDWTFADFDQEDRLVLRRLLLRLYEHLAAKS
jgi:DNA-binding MarR family transcriptional regulator